MKYAFVIILLLLIGCSRIDIYKDMKVPQCDNISETGTREICYNNLAIQRMDPGICMKITEDIYREWCLNATT